MWKTITQPEQIKNYPVGTLLRLNGTDQGELTYVYDDKNGTGFRFDPEVPDCGGDLTFLPCHWIYNRVDVWDGPSLQDELTAALKSVIDLVDRDVIHVRPSEAEEFLEALEQWNTVLAKVEESK